MRPLLLDGPAVRRLLDVEACVAAVRRVQVELSDGRVSQPPRLATPLPGGGEHLAMPAHVPADGLLGLKSISVMPANPERGRPRILGVMLLMDGDSGELLALLDAAELTLARTAAASAVATDALARPQAAVLAVVGTGPQARAHVAALRAVRPIAEVRIAGRRREAAGDLATALAVEHPDLAVVAAAGAREAVAGADVVCTVTSARTPVLRRDWLADGCHVNAVGAHHPDARELDADTLRDARVVVDEAGAALRESGDCLLAIGEGAFGPEHVADEIGAVLAGRRPGRRSATELTVYVSVGLAVQDVAVARVAYERALGG